MEIPILLNYRKYAAFWHTTIHLSNCRKKALSELPEKLQIRYFRRGSEIPDTGTCLITFT